MQEQRQFFEHDVPELFISALPAYGKRFDAVLVDEAQDFRDTWWICVYELLRQEKSSLLHLFGDARQNLFSRSEAFPFSEPHIGLQLNCRNTQEITRWIARETGVSVTTNSWCPEGEEPVVTRVNSDYEEKEAIRRLLHTLFVEERLTAEKVVILGASSWAKSIFADQPSIGPYRIEKLASAPGGVATLPTEDAGKPVVGYSSIHAFKGLEADIVILSGIGLPLRHGEDANTILYVGASRARHRLFVFKR
jgi:superfamily I DNA/RNA helicase